MPTKYLTDSCCGVNWCFAEDDATDEKPCWGSISAIDETYYETEDGEREYEWVHGCEGHQEVWHGNAYVPPPPHFIDNYKGFKE